MPKRDLAPVGAPCWIDVSTTDPAKTEAFYTELFGWTLAPGRDEFGGYRNFSLGDDLVAGFMPSHGDAPDAWSVYLAVEDAKQTADAIAAHGGQVVSPPMDVGDLGVMALALDPTGAFFGIWQPGEHKGFGVLDETNAPGWFELFTRDHAGAVAFYRDVFGWDVHVQGDTDEFRYATLGEGEGQLAGIMDAAGFLPDGVPAHWSVYVRVADVDATIARAIGLGGAEAAPAMDTPYGRLATVTDSVGAAIKLVGPNKG